MYAEGGFVLRLSYNFWEKYFDGALGVAIYEELQRSQQYAMKETEEL